MLCKVDRCTGCSACASVCPVGAIKMIEDNEGFLQPIVSESYCTRCGFCDSVCPIINPISLNRKIPEFAYAFWNSSSEIRSNSSSGGLFYTFADYILSKNGVVYGAAYDNKFCVEHVRVIDYNNLKRLQTSKYVQSRIGNCFIDVKKDLLANKYVLFTGTPCQVAGLYGYLGKDYEKLLTADFICHGVPSPGVFREYLKSKEREFNSKVISINFRAKTVNKSQNLIIDFENGKQFFEKEPLNDPFFWGFATNILLRKSCNTCEFIGFNKKSDITMGDFWGLSEKDKIDKGLDEHASLAFVNSGKATEVFNYVYNKHTVLKRSKEEAINGNLNLRKSSKRNKLRNRFFLKFSNNMSFEILATKYLTRRKFFKDYIKILLGPSLTNFIIKIFKV